MSHTVVETSSFSSSVTVPDDGNLVTGASIEVAIQPLCNRTKYLNDVLTDGTKDIHVDDITCDDIGCDDITCDDISASDIVVSGTTHLVGATAIDAATTIVATTSIGVTGTASITVATGCQLIAQAGSITNIAGRMRQRSRVQLTAADHSVGPADGLCFELAPTSATRTITLLSVTGQTALDGEILEFILPRMTLDSDGNSWIFQRESAVEVARFYSNSAVSSSVTARFEFVSPNWRLSLNSGFFPAGTPHGCAPGAGA